jgi:hypothetical protein
MDANGVETKSTQAYYNTDLGMRDGCKQGGNEEHAGIPQHRHWNKCIVRKPTQLACCRVLTCMLASCSTAHSTRQENKACRNSAARNTHSLIQLVREESKAFLLCCSHVQIDVGISFLQLSPNVLYATTSSRYSFRLWWLLFFLSVCKLCVCAVCVLCVLCVCAHVLVCAMYTVCVFVCMHMYVSVSVLCCVCLCALCALCVYAFLSVSRFS